MQLKATVQIEHVMKELNVRLSHRHIEIVFESQTVKDGRIGYNKLRNKLFKL